MLRLSLEHDAGEQAPGLLRQGRAISWIAEALAPLQGTLPEDELQRLVLAVRATTGIEARVWLVDVARLSGAEATELMRWSARALYRAAVDDLAAGRDE